MENIPHTIPPANDKHPLAVFSGNLAHQVNTDVNNWEDILNPVVHQAFGYGLMMENKAMLKGLARCGKYGLDGFCQFVEYFVIHRGLQGGLVERKVNVLLVVINSGCVILIDLTSGKLMTVDVGLGLKPVLKKQWAV